jgi:thioredoxin reductase
MNGEPRNHALTTAPRLRGGERRPFCSSPYAHPPATLDAVIVGGGPAGLSTALVLGRARKRVLVLDTGRPANAVVDRVGGLLGQAESSPADLRRAGREQLAEHPNVKVRDGAAVLDARPVADGLVVTLGCGTRVHTRALVLAHGLRYDPPPLPGIQGLWGRSVFHCPFCDGWEVRDHPLALHANGPDAVQSAIVLSGWSRDVVLCTDGPARLGDGRTALESAGVRIREEPIRELAGADGALQRIEFMSGPAERRDALFVRTQRGQPNGLAARLGCELTPGGTIVTDQAGRTEISGVYAAGDAATESMRSVANAMGTGSRVAQAVALDLIAAPVRV